MSSTIVAILFDDPQQAGRMRDGLKALQEEKLLKVEEAVVLVRDQDGKVSYDTNAHIPGALEGAAFGSLWGVLLGSIFLMPLAGLAMGALAGALSGKLGEVEVDHSFKQSINDQLRPNTSAIIIRAEDTGKGAEVLERVKGFHGKVLYTNLSTEAEQELQKALAS